MLSLAALVLIKVWTTADVFTSTLIFGVIVLICVRWLLRRRKNFPPGPMGLPYFGYVPLVCKAPHKLLDRLSKKYGKVFSINLGGRPTVVLNDFSSIKEAFSNPVFSGRPPNSIFDILINPEDSFQHDASKWAKIRRFTLHQFRDLGLGKARLEELMKDEVQLFLQELSDTDGSPLYTRKYLMPSVANNISVILFGKHFPRGHAGLTPFAQALPPSRIMCVCGILMFIPFVKIFFHLAHKFSSSEMIDWFRLYRQHVRDEIDRHKKDMSENVTHHDFIDGFLAEMEKYKGDKSNSAFTDMLLNSTVQGLLGAGSETVVTSLEWTCLLMACNPDIQTRVQNEIDENIGRERIPCWADHVCLPYTQAVLMEIQRWVTVLPINLLRCTLQDVTLQGYDIPKGTVVLANLWAVLHDPEAWNDPDKFIPERFLSSDRKNIVKPEKYIPFSYGKISCLGEPLAIQETFLYFSAIMQTFSVKLPPGQQADLEGILSIALVPKRHDLCFIRRDDCNVDV